MLASVPSGVAWACEIPQELLDAAADRPGSWEIATWEDGATLLRRRWKPQRTTIVLTEHEFNTLNATARQNIASAAREHVLRGSLEQSAARLWKTGSLEHIACRTLAPELVLRWLRAGQVDNPVCFCVWVCETLCGCSVKLRTQLRWVGSSDDEPQQAGTGSEQPSGAQYREQSPQSGDVPCTRAASPPADGLPAPSAPPLEQLEAFIADPSISEEAEERAVPQENADLATRMEEQESRVTMEDHGRYCLKTLAGNKVVVALGQDFDKDEEKTRFPEVGVVVAPCADLPNVYTNCVGNVTAAVQKRLVEKSRKCTWTKDDKAKVGKFIRAAMGPNGIFSTDRVRSWFEKHFALEDMKSSKWSQQRFVSTFEKLLTQVDPDFQFKTSVKAEHMPEGKAPRFLIADGDEGQVLALAAVKCMEEVLFETMESHSIKHVCKADAMRRLLAHTGPPRAARKLGCTFVEGDGSAWDTTCSVDVRGAIENPILEHITNILAQTYIQPVSWSEIHDRANRKKKLKLYFKRYHEKVHIVIDAIRRSGHRGTSVLNWWVNFTMWVCSLFEEPHVFLKPEVRWAVDVSGVKRWFYGVFEGDDSGVSTCPKLCQVSAEDAKALRAGEVTHAELGNKYRVPDASITASISALAFWDRAGFNMKWVFAKSRGTIVGCHIGLTETDPESKTGCVVPNGVFCPELPRALKGAVSCSPAMMEAVRKEDFKTIKTIAAGAALARASDFAGKVPTLSRKYLAYADELDSTDFNDREMSMRAVGEEGMSSAAVRVAIEAANAPVSTTEEKAFLDSLGYTATDEELERFSRYPWHLSTVDQHDEFARSLPDQWREGGSL